MWPARLNWDPLWTLGQGGCRQSMLPTVDAVSKAGCPAHHIGTVQHHAMHPRAPSPIPLTHLHRHSPPHQLRTLLAAAPAPLQVREAMDAASHPALLLVDGVSSIAALDFQFDKWGVDVAVTGSQKGLSLPTGLSVIAISDKVQSCAGSDAFLCLQAGAEL